MSDNTFAWNGVNALTGDYLAGPLANGEPAADGVPAREAPAKKHGFASRALVGPDATRANLLGVLGSPTRPAVLFTASHGLGRWPAGDPQQFAAQGALVAQDWPGLGHTDPAYYVQASDLGRGDYRGMVVFVFACYGAGTPQHDDFHTDPRDPRVLADRPFVSALARRLLAGGALAVVGHVARAWSYSIRPPDVGPQLLPFRNWLTRVLGGEPAGHATLDFSQRYATASVALANLLAPLKPGAAAPADDALVTNWVERNDPQNYVLLGDPAVRLRVADARPPDRDDIDVDAWVWAATGVAAKLGKRVRITIDIDPPGG